MCKLYRFTVKVYIIYFPVQVYTKPVYCKRLHNACLLLSVHKVSLPSTVQVYTKPVYWTSLLCLLATCLKKVKGWLLKGEIQFWEKQTNRRMDLCTSRAAFLQLKRKNPRKDTSKVARQLVFNLKQSTKRSNSENLVATFSDPMMLNM